MRSKPITDPATGQFIANDPVARLMQFRSIDPVTGCWLWSGGIVRGGLGYGRVCISRRQFYVHRLAAVVFLGFDPDSPLKVLHRCDVPACFNPAHLFIGTPADNNADRDRKGRTTHGEQHARSKITAADVRAIRAAVAGGMLRAEAARRFGLSAPHTTAIVERRAWKHVN